MEHALSAHGSGRARGADTRRPRPRAASVAGLVGLVLTLAALPAGTAAGAEDPPPTHALSVSGPGVASYPAFDPAITRYGATTTVESDGSLVVTATTSDPSGTVLVDGAPVTGPTTVEGLEEGEEVSVLIDDSGGTTAYSVVYLPADFPTLEVTVPAGEGSAVADGAVLLTLSRWVAPGSQFEVAIDAHGVPLWVDVPEFGSSMDFKPLPGGGYSIFRRPSDDLAASATALRLDDSLEVLESHTTVGLEHTDAHDIVWNDDGSVYISAYEPDAESGLVDAIVQHVDGDGTVLWEWNSADHGLVDETVWTNDTDYAHLNSIQVMDDGDLLLSFRHLSAVLKVARTPHDGFASGDVVWRLGGRHSDFTFPDDPDGTGPCAQHTAYQQPDGTILMFDNGSWDLSTPLCVDQSDPLGPVVQRPVTRILGLALDEETMEASVVENHQVDGRFAVFAGSAERLAGGTTLVGWASSTAATASELGPDGEVLWEVRNVATESGPPYFTYRAAYADFPDALAPSIAPGPEAAAPLRLGAAVGAVHRCTDRGGSGLASCEASAAPSTLEPGEHTVDVVAVDGAGNRTEGSVAYEVADSRADLWIGGGRGRDVVGGDLAGQTQTVRTAGRRTRVTLHLDHDAAVADRVALAATLRGDTDAFRLRWKAGGEDVTAAVRRGSYRPRVRADEVGDLRLVVVPRRSAGRRDVVRVVLEGRATLGSGDRDRVRVRARG